MNLQQTLELSIQHATAELQTVPKTEIERRTAITWAARAISAYRLKMYSDVADYAHEAIEHAAVSGDDQLPAYLRAAIHAG